MTTVVHDYLAEIAADCKAGIKRDASLWVKTVRLALDELPQPETADERHGKACKEMFKAIEAKAEGEHKVNLKEYANWRAVKAPIVRAYAQAITLLNEKGDVRGKSEIEKLTKKENTKTPWELFSHHINKALENYDDLNDQEAQEASVLIKTLIVKLETRSNQARLKLAA